LAWIVQRDRRYPLVGIHVEKHASVGHLPAS
jgi:hypothetical protein